MVKKVKLTYRVNSIDDLFDTNGDFSNRFNEVILGLFEDNNVDFSLETEKELLTDDGGLTCYTEDEQGNRTYYTC